MSRLTLTLGYYSDTDVWVLLGQYLAILSQPPGSIRGNLRVTIQGEVIESYFGTKPSSELTFERYTTAVLKATLVPPSPPEDSYREVLEAHVGIYVVINIVVVVIIIGFCFFDNIVFLLSHR